MLYAKDSLDELRARIDLPELLSSYLQLKRAGASYKACCPFHEEKTPSFVVQAGDTHYHCYGCGAHGDAIAFLMSFLKISFVDAVDMLAERFGVTLMKSEETQQKGPSKSLLKEILEKTCAFYHFLLLYSEEGHQALAYLYERGIDLAFIKAFRIGYAPASGNALARFLKGYDREAIHLAGLSGQKRDFFSERITFPICDSFGSVIGFSARKFKENTWGGKYINTPETLLFKKSHLLFGLHLSRQRMAKERRALLVEGQIDALRLIFEGLDFTVAAQGTAFGEGHVKQLLDLGVHQVYLALDADKAGQEAAVKIGHLLQKKGVGVSVLDLPAGSDPDQLLREKGPADFNRRIDTAKDYLSFLVTHLSKTHNLQIPAQKNEMVQKIARLVKEWEQPVMVHESLRKVAQLTGVPEEVLGVEGTLSRPAIPRPAPSKRLSVDADRILETDLLRWLIARGGDLPRLVEIAQRNLTPALLRNETCRKLYEAYLSAYAEGRPLDLMTLGTSLQQPEEQELLSEIVQKRVNWQRAEEGLIAVAQAIIQRQWMEEREELRHKIQSGGLPETELWDMVKAFDRIKKDAPQLQLP